MKYGLNTVKLAKEVSIMVWSNGFKVPLIQAHIHSLAILSRVGSGKILTPLDKSMQFFGFA